MKWCWSGRTGWRKPSGKIRRADTKNLYLTGTLDAAPAALWRQFLRLGIGAAKVEMRRYWRVGASRAFAVYWWAAMGVAMAVGCIAIALGPSLALRWRGVRIAARLGLRLTGALPTVDGLQHVPPQGGVLVANHASYLDAMALIAAIPGEYNFVAKGELASRFPAGWLLRRLGTLFVDRADRDSGPKGTAIAIQAAQSGSRLLFFPEGTLMRQPGLLAFKLGAFAVAVGASQPVIPVALTGTRTILRGGQWFPQPGRLHVHIAPLIKPEGEGMAAIIALRDGARASILAHCGEPDRAADRLVFTSEGVERAE